MAANNLLGQNSIHFKPIHMLRIAVAILLGIHGYYRALSGGVAGFSEFLAYCGFPLASVLAWSVTIFEMLGSLCLLTGRFLRLVILGFVFILSNGILLVHAREGWFVVGGGRNGVEYSILLIAVLLTIYFSERPKVQSQV